jgi:hypothetical protein
MISPKALTSAFVHRQMPHNAHENEQDWDSEASSVNARMKVVKAFVRFLMEKEVSSPLCSPDASP